MGRLPIFLGIYNMGMIGYISTQPYPLTEKKWVDRSAPESVMDSIRLVSKIIFFIKL